MCDSHASQTGTYLDEKEGIEERDDCNNDDCVNASGGKKRKQGVYQDGDLKAVKAQYCHKHLKASEASRVLKLLKDAITKYVETPRHTSEVLKSLQSMLETDFSMRHDMKHLLPCLNGVVDLKTSKLIGKAKPDDLFTHACPTEYDPDIDIWPVEQFYKTYFPCENNDDPVQVAQSQEFVRFMQIWLGYCITAETKLELCVWFYGRGSNGKTLLSKIVGDVLGNVEDHGVFSTLPADALSKERGVNNDSLSDAVDARHVFISETDKTMRINEAAFRSLVSAEPQHLKRMYKAEKSCKPNAKYTFAVNDLPQWKDADAYHTRRRNIYILLQKIYVNLSTPEGKQKHDEYQKNGKMHMIAERDVTYYEDKVLPHKPAFLKFWIRGAMEFYKTKDIPIPSSMIKHQEHMAYNKNSIVLEYVEEHLCVVPSAKLRLDDILNDFRRTTRMEEETFSNKAFFNALHEAIAEMGPDWKCVDKYNGRDGSRRKEGKGMLYSNLTFKKSGKAPWNDSLLPGRVVTNDRYTPDNLPAAATPVSLA